MRHYYVWFATTLTQERYVVALLLVGLLGTGAAWAIVTDAGPVASLERVALIGIVGSVALWALTNVEQVGGHRAVGLMATHANPIQAVNEIAFTVDMVNLYCEAAASFLLALGFAALGLSLLRKGHPRDRGSVWLIFAIAVAALAMGVGKLSSGDWDRWFEIGLGAVLLPAWLCWTTRALHASSDETPFPSSIKRTN